jgi:hypothetical protein
LVPRLSGTSGTQRGRMVWRVSTHGTAGMAWLCARAGLLLRPASVLRSHRSRLAELACVIVSLLRRDTLTVLPARPTGAPRGGRTNEIVAEPCRMASYTVRPIRCL